MHRPTPHLTWFDAFGQLQLRENVGHYCESHEALQVHSVALLAFTLRVLVVRIAAIGQPVRLLQRFGTAQLH
jgi:hypothetical protein